MAHGSVMQLENGKFRVCFEYGFDENGRRVRKHKTFASRKEAELMLARHDVAMEDGTVGKPREMTLAEWLSYWMKKHVYASGCGNQCLWIYQHDRPIHRSTLGEIKAAKA